METATVLVWKEEVKNRPREYYPYVYIKRFPDQKLSTLRKVRVCTVHIAARQWLHLYTENKNLPNAVHVALQEHSMVYKFNTL